MRFDGKTLLDGDYLVKVYNTTVKNFELFGQILSARVSEKDPFFSEIYPVKDNKIIINGAAVPLFDNPRFKMKFCIGVAFTGNLDNGYYIDGRKMSEPGEGSPDFVA